MVERQLPKLHTRVRFPSPAPQYSGSIDRWPFDHLPSSGGSLRYAFQMFLLNICPFTRSTILLGSVETKFQNKRFNNGREV